MLKFIKDWMLPIAMITGSVTYPWVSKLSFLTPYLIFTMLLLTFSKITWKEIRLQKAHVWLLLIQLIGSFVAYLLIRPFNEIIGQGALLCILAPTATAAAVITGMLGGRVGFLTAYVLFCNIAVAIVAPFYFSVIGVNEELSFIESVWFISQKVFPLLIIPLFMASFIRICLPKLNHIILKASKATFYIWSFALVIVTGITVNFIINQERANYSVAFGLAGVSLVICCLQFLIGRRIGRAYGDPVSSGQGLGQKNTILALWMAQMYLDPLVSIAPASYILWQNIINSYQLWRKKRNQ